MIISQDTAVEVTKNQYFKVHFHIRGCSCEDRTVLFDLLYEDQMAVPPGVGRAALEAKADWSSSNDFIVTARINELSHAHRNRRFIIRIEHGGMTVYTSPMKVMSKSSIVKAHLSGDINAKRKRCADDDALEARQTERNVRLLTDEVAALRAFCVQADTRAHQLSSTVEDQIAMLRGEVTTLSGSLASFTSLIESFLSPPVPAALKTPHDPFGAFDPVGLVPNGGGDMMQETDEIAGDVYSFFGPSSIS